MLKRFKIIWLAVKTVFKKTRYKLSFLALSLVFFSLYVLIPVWLTPGNSIDFQLSLFSFTDYLLLAILSISASFFTLSQLFLLFQSKRRSIVDLGQGGVGLISALFGGLLATAACSSCIAVILGFLGIGGVFFVLENQRYIVVLSIGLVIIGLYFTAKRLVGVCRDCQDLDWKFNNKK